MDTYIVRIHRRREEGKSPVSVGIVEDAESGRTKKFADSGELLKILKLGECATGEVKGLQPKKIRKQF